MSRRGCVGMASGGVLRCKSTRFYLAPPPGIAAVCASQPIPIHISRPSR